LHRRSFCKRRLNNCLLRQLDMCYVVDTQRPLMLDCILNRLRHTILERVVVFNCILNWVFFARKWKRLIWLDILRVSDLSDQVQLRGYFFWENPFVFGELIVFNACGRLKHVGSLKFKNLRALIYEIVLVETWHILPFLSVNFIDHALHYTDA